MSAIASAGSDFGGHGPELHFAHANGYPPGAYAPLFEQLTPHFHVNAMRFRPLRPGARPEALPSWQPLVDELIQFLDQAGARGWLGVGHSLGAVVTAAAALARPELFSALVLIEPVFFTPRRMRLYSVLQRLGLVRRIHPLVAAALRRRGHFSSADEMFARYRNAPVFSGMDDRGLRAYVDALAAPSPLGAEPGVDLAFSPEWEARIYETGPLNLWNDIGRLRLRPALVIRAAQTDAFEAGAVSALRRRLPQAQIVQLASGTHLAPLEQPAQIAELILNFTRQPAAGVARQPAF